MSECGVGQEVSVAAGVRITRGLARVLMMWSIVALLGIDSTWAEDLSPEATEDEPQVSCKPVVPEDVRRGAEAELRGKVGSLQVSYGVSRQVPRTVLNPVGFLTEERRGADPATVAGDFLSSHREFLGLTTGDLKTRELTDSYRSEVSGVTRFYWRQTHGGLPLHNGQLQIHVGPAGRILSVNTDFVPGLAGAVNTSEPGISAELAVQRAAAEVGLVLEASPKPLAKPTGIDRRSVLDPTGISRQPIEARLAWFAPSGRCDVRLAWSFSIETLAGDHAYDQLVDAVTGEVLWRQDRVLRDGYAVLPLPRESPDHGEQEKVFNPAHPGASLFGWHDIDGSPGADFSTLQGNNAHAYLDLDDDDFPSSGETSCEDGQSCYFELDLAADPMDNAEAALTNAFYWTNVVHDVTALYGFDEAAGNFQELNYTEEGLGADSVQVEVLDGADLGHRNNAYFRAAVEGSEPKLELLLWDQCTSCSQERDSAFDSGIIVHEYAHGISTRLVGGPNAVSCLSNSQQAGEGISDFLGLVFTHPAGLDGDDGRGIGAYMLGEPPGGPGIRLQRYSTDPTLNTTVYETIASRTGPHAIGEIWAQAAWEAYWALIDRHGFDPDLYDARGVAGNQRMLLYTIQGLAGTACSPTFADLRDGIIQAAIANHRGEDVCLLWNTFADFGLGIDADPGGPTSTRVINGFSPPGDCGCVPSPPDLLAWWTLDEPEVDIAHDMADLDAGHHAVPNGLPRAGRGLVDDGMVFDGIDDHLEVPASDDFNGIDETGFSLEGWILPQWPIAAGQRVPLWHVGQPGTQGRSVVLYLDSQRALTLAFYDNGSLVSFSTGPGVVGLKRWNHLAITLDGAAISNNRVWVDGVEEASRFHSFRMANGGTGLRLGGDPATGGAFFQGHMDEIGFYRFSLSQGEVQQIFDAYNAGRCKSYCGLPKSNFDRVFQLYQATPNFSGASGADLILGSPGADDIHGRNGADCIYGFGGDDVLRGDRGPDTIFGGAGGDNIEGNADDDEIFGGPGNDVIRGRRGADIIEGGPDDDEIEGNDGDDEISGGADDDLIDGGDGRDTIHGDGGRDRLRGGPNDDTITGGDGEDFLRGEYGSDVLEGGEGDDRLCGEENADELDGGPGTDEYRGGAGNDTAVDVETSIARSACNNSAFESW